MGRPHRLRALATLLLTAGLCLLAAPAAGAVVVGQTCTTVAPDGTTSTYSCTYTAGRVRIDYFDTNGVAGTLSSGTRGALPSSTVTTATSLSSTPNRADFYGTRMRAYVIPSTTGSYRFRLHSDDQGALLLSTSSATSGLRMIAASPMWDVAFTESTSAAITLTAGTPYLLEGWQADWASGDLLSVEWLPAGSSTWQSVPSANLADPGNVGCTGWCPPTAVSFTSGQTFASNPVISWNAFPGAASYRVYRWSPVTNVVTLLGTPTGTTITDPAPDRGWLNYNITALDASGQPLAVGDGYGGFYDPDAPTAPTIAGVPTAPTAPVTLTASASSDAITWIDRYERRISTDGGATWGAITTDDTATLTTLGSYVVAFRAVDGAGNASAFSSALTVIFDATAPPAPTGFAIDSPTRLPHLTWDAVSDDDTGRIARSYAERDPRIRVHTNPETVGMPDNWNLAVGHARGRWVKLLPADDLLQPECLDLQVKDFEAHPGVALVACRRDFVDSHGDLYVSEVSYTYGVSTKRLHEGCDAHQLQKFTRRRPS